MTAVAVVNRSVGGSFIACGLIAWQRRPDSRTGPLMTLTGFLFLSEALLSEVDSHVAYTLGQWSANWWTPPFAALVLGFPSGRLSSRVDRAIVGGFVFTRVVGSSCGCSSSRSPEDGERVPDLRRPGPREHDRPLRERLHATLGLALAIVGISRWFRAAPPLRRLLLPTLAGSLTALVLIIQTYYALLTGEFIRASQEVTSVLLVSVPLAFLFGILHQQLARAGMADLVVALHRAPESRRLDDALAKALGDPSLVLAYWLPRFDAYVDADGSPVALPEPGSGRAATFVEHEGQHVAALVHDAALAHQPDLLEVVCAAANVALEHERLQAELGARVVELQASRERIVAASDAERRRLERNLHDGAQQRLVAIALQLRLLQGHVGAPVVGGARARRERPARAVAGRAARAGARPPPCGARARPRAGAGVAGAALDGHHHGVLRAARTAPRAGRAGGLLRGLRGAGQRRQIRRGFERDDARLARQTGSRASRSPTTASAAPTTPPAPGCAAWPTGSRRCRAACAWSARRGGDHRHRGAAVRVVIADDSLLVRAGIVALLREAGIDVVRRRRPRRTSCATSTSTAPTSRSWTSGCHRTSPTRACAPRRSSARATRGSRS